MNSISRVKTIVGSKINKILGRMEDPTETLDYSYEKQKELLINVKKGISELTTSKKRLEIQREKLKDSIVKFEEQAKEAMRQGNEPLARAALERKTRSIEEVGSLTKSIDNLSKEQAKLTETGRILEIKIEQLKSSKETIKAEYSAALASSKIKESLSGIGDQVGNIGTAMDRARDKTEEMKAKSSAIDELVEAGVLDDLPGDRQDSIDKELSKVRTKGRVDTEFENMRREMRLKNNDLNALLKSNK